MTTDNPFVIEAARIKELDRNATPVPWEHRLFAHNSRTAIQAGSMVLVLRRLSALEHDAEVNDQELVTHLRNRAPVIAEVFELIAEVEGAMKFYAARESYRSDVAEDGTFDAEPVIDDDGEQARAALSHLAELKGRVGK